MNEKVGPLEVKFAEGACTIVSADRLVLVENNNWYLLLAVTTAVSTALAAVLGCFASGYSILAHRTVIVRQAAVIIIARRNVIVNRKWILLDAEVTIRLLTDIRPRLLI